MKFRITLGTYSWCFQRGWTEVGRPSFPMNLANTIPLGWVRRKRALWEGSEGKGICCLITWGSLGLTRWKERTDSLKLFSGLHMLTVKRTEVSSSFLPALLQPCHSHHAGLDPQTMKVKTSFLKCFCQAFWHNDKSRKQAKPPNSFPRGCWQISLPRNSLEENEREVIFSKVVRHLATETGKEVYWLMRTFSVNPSGFRTTDHPVGPEASSRQGPSTYSQQSPGLGGSPNPAWRHGLSKPCPNPGWKSREKTNILLL